jgi:hypothetical protein
MTSRSIGKTVLLANPFILMIAYVLGLTMSAFSFFPDTLWHSDIECQQEFSNAQWIQKLRDNCFLFVGYDDDKYSRPCSMVIVKSKHPLKYIFS